MHANIQGYTQTCMYRLYSFREKGAVNLKIGVQESRFNFPAVSLCVSVIPLAGFLNILSVDELNIQKKERKKKEEEKNMKKLTVTPFQLLSRSVLLHVLRYGRRHCSYLGASVVDTGPPSLVKMEGQLNRHMGNGVTGSPSLAGEGRARASCTG